MTVRSGRARALVAGMAVAFLFLVGSQSVSALEFLFAFGSPGNMPGQFQAPSGVAEGLSGTLYVADTGNNRIQAFDSAGGYLTTVATPGSQGGQVQAPGGIATDAAGSIYIADTGNNRIQKLDSTGAFQWAAGFDVSQAPGAGYEVCTNAVDCKAGDGTGNNSGQFSQPAGLTVSTGGVVFVADTNNNRIQKSDSPPSSWAVFAGPGTAGGQVMAPRGIFVDSTDKLYIADTANNRIQAIDSGGTFLWAAGVDVTNPPSTGYETCTNAGDCKVGMPGNGLGQFNQPSGIASSSDTPGIFVADTNNNRIQRSTGDPSSASGWSVFQGPGTAVGTVNAPRGVTVSSGGSVFVGDTGNNRIQVHGPPPPAGPQPPPSPSNKFTIRVTFTQLVVGVTSPGTVSVKSPTGPKRVSPRGAAGAKRLLKPSRAKGGPGKIVVPLKLTKGAKRALHKRGKLTVRALIAFKPVGGSARSRTATLRLKRQSKP